MKPSRSDRGQSNSLPILKAKDVSGGQCCTPEQTSALLLSQVYSKYLKVLLLFEFLFMNS